MYTIVMPIKIGAGNGYQIFSKLGLKSYEKYLDTKRLVQFIIVAPAQDIPELIKLTNNSNIPFKILPEECLIKPHILYETQGWFKQQLIKLLVASKVLTRHYLIVDSDMYLTQRLEYTDLFHNGRIKYNYEPWQTENSKQFSQNSKWWEGSCDVLGEDVSGLFGQEKLMSVTPEVLITDLVAGLIGELEHRHGFSNWEKIVCDKKFTEFTLYWLYIRKKGLEDLYTTEGFPLWKHDLDRNILHPEHISVENITRSFTERGSFFGVIQGYLDIPLESMIEEGQKRLELPDLDAVFLVASMLSPQRHQSFAVEERFEQTISTARSAREKVPNCMLILIEGSVLSPEHKEGFLKHYDIVIECGKDETILPYVHHPTNIGHGECALLGKGVWYLKQEILPKRNVKLVYKLGARYCLTENFNFTNFPLDKFTFREHHDESINAPVYTTGLYSIPLQYLNFYEKVLADSHSILSITVNMVEKMYHDMIPKEYIYKIPTIGIAGALSYNKHYFSV